MVSFKNFKETKVVHVFLKKQSKHCQVIKQTTNKIKGIQERFYVS